MTRKITKQAARAWIEGRRFKLSNTLVTQREFYLFDNKIAWRQNPNASGIWFSMCGWNTVTTKERLKAVGVNLYQNKGKVFIQRLVPPEYYPEYFPTEIDPYEIYFIPNACLYYENSLFT